MLIIMTGQISLLVELVVSMHGRTELKLGLRIQWVSFCSCQQQYGHSVQMFACWHTNQSCIPSTHLKDLATLIIQIGEHDCSFTE